MNDNRRQATKLINQKIYKEAFLKFKSSFDINPLITNDFFSFFEKRLQTQQCFRPYFIVAIQQYIKECVEVENMNVSIFEKSEINQLLEIGLPFLAEVVIVIQYLDNHILDGKYGIKHVDKSLKNTFLSSLFLKDYLFEYVDNLKVDNNLKHLISSHLRRIFLFVNLGQKIELSFCRNVNITDFKSIDLGNNLEDFIDFSGMEKPLNFTLNSFDKCYHNYLLLYFKRMYLTTGSLYILFTELIMQILRYDGIEKKRLLQFVRCFSICRQLVNDNCDVVPSNFNLKTNAKNSNDAFSDLKNLNITLPLLFYNASGKNINYKKIIVENNPFNKDTELEIFRALQNSFAIYKSVSIARLFKNNSLIYLSKNKFSIHIIGLLSIANKNKFYTEIYNDAFNIQMYKRTLFYKSYKRTKKELCQETKL